MRDNLAVYISTRVSKDTRAALVKKASKEYNAGVAVVLRELVLAFVENRITVKPVTKEFLE